jgi:hypothetical protein
MATGGRLRKSRECAGDTSHEASGPMEFWFTSGVGIPIDKAGATCCRTGREYEGSCSGNGQRKAAKAEPRRPEGTDWFGFSV